ncbi:hypothetical protein [Thermus aquaticus]|uniref:Uncharacterized protein n=1 Tax=Thermus aquaticus (strain ATCC BAA-2747 / Y51MC23) TaxID=498848 RepID=A0ABN4IKP8_THEA5|nr:hypothetical protein TO73_0789 [Thermus aquaticus Y51MC23]
MGLLPYRLALLLSTRSLVLQREVPKSGPWKVFLGAPAAAGCLLLPRPHPKPPPALVRAYPETRSPLTLNLPYYAARKGEGFALIPWDRYMEEAENLLQGLGEEGP